MTVTTAASLENRLRQIIGNIRNLPTPPIVFEQIQKVMSDPDASMGDVAAILAEDPAMSVKVLKLTNSAFYGLSREIDSVKHAVMIIGLEAVKNLVLSASVLNMFKANEGNKEYHESFWRHSLAAAFASRIIAQRLPKGKIFNPDPAFSSGLVHDIGKMVFCCFMPKELKAINEYLQEHPAIPDTEAEVAVLGFTHAQLGRQLAINWKLPSRMADTIGYHHNPQLTNSSDDFAYLINLADYLALQTFSVDILERTPAHLSQAVLNFFATDESEIEALKALLVEEYMKAETFIAIAAT